MIAKLYDIAMRAPHLRPDQVPTWQRELFDAADSALGAGVPAADVYLALINTLNRVPRDPAEDRRRSIAEGEFKKLPTRVQHAMAEVAYASLHQKENEK